MFYPLALSPLSIYITLLSFCNKFLSTLSMRIQIKIILFSLCLSFLSPILYFSVFPKGKTDVKIPKFPKVLISNIVIFAIFNLRL